MPLARQASPKFITRSSRCARWRSPCWRCRRCHWQRRRHPCSHHRQRRARKQRPGTRHCRRWEPWGCRLLRNVGGISRLLVGGGGGLECVGGLLLGSSLTASSYYIGGVSHLARTKGSLGACKRAPRRRAFRRPGSPCAPRGLGWGGWSGTGRSRRHRSWWWSWRSRDGRMYICARSILGRGADSTVVVSVGSCDLGLDRDRVGARLGAGDDLGGRHGLVFGHCHVHDRGRGMEVTCGGDILAVHRFFFVYSLSTRVRPMEIVARICTVRFLSAVRAVAAHCKHPFCPPPKPGLTRLGAY